MRKNILFLALSLLFFGLIPLRAQNSNSNPDDILGTYYVVHEGEESRVKVFKAEDGTYTGQVIWVKEAYDKDGNKRLDPKNPDKSLRDTPCDEIVILKGISYNEKKQRWDGGKVYDPTRGFNVGATVWFDDSDGKLHIRGSFMGISETVVWVKE